MSSDQRMEYLVKVIARCLGHNELGVQSLPDTIDSASSQMSCSIERAAKALERIADALERQA